MRRRRRRGRPRHRSLRRTASDRAEALDGSPRAPPTTSERRSPGGRSDPVRRAEEPRPPARDRRSRARSSSTSASTRTTLRERVLADIRRPPRPGDRHLARRPRRRSRLEIADDILGHGPLERLLADDTVTEIMVNGPYDDLDRARRAGCTQTTVQLQRRVAPAPDHQQDRRPGRPPHRRVLADGRRAPARRQPRQRRSSRRSRSAARCVTIRKFARSRLDARRPDHASARSRPETVEFLERCVQAQLNILISGGTGIGQDDAAERALGGDPGRRADRHDRGRGRAAAPPARTCCGSSPARRTSRARARSRSATSSATACACGPTGSSSARSAAPRRSTCCRR